MKKFRNKFAGALIIVGLLMLGFNSTVQAENVSIIYEPPCNADTLKLGECGGEKNKYKCVSSTEYVDNQVITTVRLSTEPICDSTAIGNVDPPFGISGFNSSTGSTDTSGQQIGIIYFLSNLIKVFAIITGIWAMFNFIKAGYTLITSMSDAGAMEKVKNSITMTVIGLTIIASAYIIAAVAGALLFGDPTFILSPKLQGALQ